MNFLQLSQKLRQEAEIPGTGPSAVTGQVGQLKRLVDWTADAWLDIQNRHQNWRWMRKGFTVNTVLDDDSYAYGDVTDVDTAAPIARFSRWLVNDPNDPALCYLQSGGVGGQYRLIWTPWNYFKQIYKIGTQTNGSPAHITVDHANNLVIGPKPNGVYVVTGDFQRGAQILAVDGDIPDMPTDYHNLVVYWAMLKYGANSVASEIFARASSEGTRMMRSLELNQLPEIEMPGPLA